MLGGTIDTIEKHYTPFVKELRDRVNNILETGTGIEESGKITPEVTKNSHRTPNSWQKLKNKGKHPKAGVCWNAVLIKCRDFIEKFCQSLATIADLQNLIAYLSNTKWRMSL